MDVARLAPREEVNAGEDKPRVLRGGAFYDVPWDVRCAARGRRFPDDRLRRLGFRVVVRPSA